MSQQVEPVDADFTSVRLREVHFPSLESHVEDDLAAWAEETGFEVTEDRRAFIGWNWGFDEAILWVELSMVVTPCKDDRVSARAECVGEFEVIGRPDIVTLFYFVQFSAVNMLFPYLRQVVWDITQRVDPHGGFLHNTIAVSSTASQFDLSLTTGFSQLKAGEARDMVESETEDAAGFENELDAVVESMQRVHGQL